MNFKQNLKKWPSKNQWGQIFKILNKKEKIVFFVLLFLFLGSSIFLILNYYFKNTELRPIVGGSFVEGIIGSPRFINPIYSDLSDTDKDLVQLIFSGLMKYNSSGEIIPDLISEYEIIENGKVFEIHLKENILWSDGEKLTIDDVIFTIETIQNPEYKSPLRPAWIGVLIEKNSDLSMRVKLKDSSIIFLENLTLKILPRHIWQDIQPENFPLSAYNLQPIGSGPYQFKKIIQDKSGHIKCLSLIRNPFYFGEEPKIKEIKFNFYNNEEELKKAIQKKEINNFSFLNPDYFNFFKRKELKLYSFYLPRYFAVFFNTEKSEILSNKKIRQALNYATDKEKIINEIFGDFKQGEIIHSPVLPKIYGLQEPTKIYEFNKEKAEEILDELSFFLNDDNKREKIIKTETITAFKGNLKIGSQGTEVKELQRCLSVEPANGEIDIYPEAKITGIFDKKTQEAVIRFQEKYSEEILKPWGFTKGTGLVSETTRKVLNELCDLSPIKTISLKISLTTIDQPLLIKVANALKNQWTELGIETTIKIFNSQISERDNIIKNRDYESLLFGEALSSILDPLPFWHSLQKKDPGSNLSLYENKEADKLLEKIRQSMDLEIRAQELEKFQNILIEDAPAIFLYSQDYIYAISKKIKGAKEAMIIDPSKRFSGIESWYIKTKRIWK